MKKLLFIAFASLMIVPAFAQRGNGTGQENQSKLTVEERAQRRTEKLSRELALTADQKTKVHDVVLASMKKSEEIDAKYKDNAQSEAKKQEIDQARKSHRDALKAILTPEQQKKMAQMNQNRAKRAKANGKDLKEIDQH